MNTALPLRLTRNKEYEMKETIIYTALPDGVEHIAGKTFLRLTVFVSPRLAGDQPLTDLSLFPNFKNWPEQVNQIQWRLRFENQQTHEWTDITDIKLRSKPADSQLWQALLGKCVVESYQFPNLASYQVLSYPVKPVWDKLEGLYLQYAARQEAPSTRELVEDPRVQALAIAGGVGEFVKIPWLEKKLETKLTPDPQLLNNLKQVRDFYPGKTQTPKQMIIPRLDFHKAVAALGEYPLLLRRLGLALDLLVAYDDKIPHGTGQTTVRVTLEEPEAQTPSTLYHLSPPPRAYFICAPRGNDILGRRLQLGSNSEFAWLEVDADGAIFKALDFGVNVFRLFAKYSVGVPEQAALPALRSGGLSVVRSGRGKALKQAIQTGINNDAKVGTSSPKIVLAAQDVNRGYRLDVWDEKAKRWLSLCQRIAEYKITETGQILTTPDLGKLEYEESAVAPAERKEDEAGSKKLYAHEALFHWDGWSLGVPRPEKTMGTGGKPASDQEINTETSNTMAGEQMRLPLEATFSVLKGSLPRLRFGHTYRLRARLVDLAGNSETLDPFSQPDNDTDTGTATYKRFEPLPAPLLIPVIDFGEEVGPLKEPRSPGESLERLVIRSFNNDLPKDTQPTQSRTERRVAPPPCAQIFAETHGMFDAPQNGNDWALDTSAYQTIIKNEELPKAIVPLKSQEDGNPPQIYQLSYLPDPLARAALFFGLPGTFSPGPQSIDLGEGAEWIDIQIAPERHCGVVRIDLLPSSKWPEALPLRLALVEGDTPPKWDSKRRILEVALRKAQTAEVSVCSGPEDVSQLDLLQTWDWVKARAPIVLPQLSPKEVEKWARAGRFPMLTPACGLHLVHTVQQPIGLPQFGPDANKVWNIVNKAAPGATDIFIQGGLHVDGPSTVKVDVVGRWQDWTESSSQGKVTGVAKASLQAQVIEEILGEAQAKWDFYIRHELGDTKHRWVDYVAIATSRFKEYFSEILPVTRESPLTNLNRQVNILNSARPPALKLLYVIPLFIWKRTMTETGEIQSSRLGGLRIYLEPPWYVSGDDEKLGLVTWTPQGQPDVTQIPESLKPYVTAWGNDPIRLSPLLSLNTLGLSRLAPMSLDEGQRQADMDQRGKNLTLPEAPQNPVTAQWFTVEFDPQQNLYFADIGVDPTDAYMPFVRLALARFQPYSINGLHLSPVTQLDFVQITPDRYLSVSWNPEQPEEIGVALSGPMYEQTPVLGGDMYLVEHAVQVHMEAFYGSPEEMAEPMRWQTMDSCFVYERSKSSTDPANLIWKGEVVFNPITEAPCPQHPRKLVVEEYELNWNDERQQMEERLIYAEGIVVGIS
jgi:hypothetical protein